MKEKQNKILFWLVLSQLLCLFMIAVWVLGSDALRDFLGNLPFFGASILLVFLGVILAVLIKKYEVARPLRKFLIMSSYSAIYFLPATIIHNFLEVGGQQLGGLFGSIMGFLSAVFFLTSLIGVPIFLLIGVIGSLGLLLRKY